MDYIISQRTLLTNLGLNRLSKPDHFCYIVRENFIIVKLTYIHHKPDFCHYVPLRLIDRKGNQDI
jgi:hypothetical protein